MPAAKLLEIAACDVAERNAERVSGDREAPEGVTELLDETIASTLALLEDTFPYEAEHLTRFFSQASGGVEEPLVGGEGRIRGA